jgi:two-component system, chemotaxis family, protein-glutamate methylesterase/glutaminase
MAGNAIVVIGASEGGLAPLRQITEGLLRNCGASVFVVMHTGDIPSSLPEILRWRGQLTVAFGRDGASIKPGRIYVAPRDQHMIVMVDHIELNRSALVHHTRPSIDPLFASAAKAFGKRVVGIVLSGTGSDGADGLAAISANGGCSFVQEPGEASSPGMPQAAIAADDPERLPIDAIARRVAEFCSTGRR